MRLKVVKLAGFLIFLFIHVALMYQVFSTLTRYSGLLIPVDLGDLGSGVVSIDYMILILGMYSIFAPIFVAIWIGRTETVKETVFLTCTLLGLFLVMELLFVQAVGSLQSLFGA